MQTFCFLTVGPDKTRQLDFCTIHDSQTKNKATTETKCLTNTDKTSSAQLLTVTEIFARRRDKNDLQEKSAFGDKRNGTDSARLTDCARQGFSFMLPFEASVKTTVVSTAAVTN